MTHLHQHNRDASSRWGASSRHSLPVLARRSLAVPAVLGALVCSTGDARAQTPLDSQCVACHRGLPDARLSAPATLFAGADVHRERRFTCVDCHGGDGAAIDKGPAHDRGKAGFQGSPAGTALIKTCSRCHSDAELMRRYAPRQRVDQEAEYIASVHGKKLAQGDRAAATCVSCHGAHGIRPVQDAKSPVFAANVAATCATCHASATHMKGRTLADGSAVSTSQTADYQKSVHAAALANGDTRGAPTCNDCHGNHGAAPPGIEAVTNVCGTCHTVFAERFDASIHKELFSKGCVECHGNHAVLKSGDEMLGSRAPSLCATCHSGPDDKGAQTADALRAGLERLKTDVNRTEHLIATIRQAGMEVGTQELALADARTKLTVARTELHASDRTRVDPVLADGQSIVADVQAAAARALDELRFRRLGLALSLAAILLVVVALVLKIREIDRRPPSPPLQHQLHDWRNM